ncbi:thiolase domain-containing protein [bacterium]|nr:thiolase domain-containing protein [bacterium]
MRKVAIIGIGMNKWGELWDTSLRELYTEAALAAMDDAGVARVDSMYIGCMSSGLFTGQEHLSSLMADYTGMAGTPATRVESACNSGGVALRQGFIEVASGMSDLVLVGGVEKMTDVDGGMATYALATAADQDYESFHGVTFPGLYAMIANAHMARYGTTREQLAMVAVKNHHNGSMNARAQYPFEITVEGVLDSVRVADPLRILDCSPITDGAAAVILCPLEKAKEYSDKAVVEIVGSGHATDTIALHSRKDLSWLGATYTAAQRAYAMASCKPEDIDLAEVHDCFTIAEICVTEALGFFDKGDGGPAVERGDTAITGKIPVNSSGGLKSKGHPVGATGVAQIVELTEQLRGESGKRQVKNARRGLAQNMGGSGGSTTVHILEVK